jgi:integrase
MACVVYRSGAKCWSGRYRHDGREYVKSLGVKIIDRDLYTEEGIETEAFLRSKDAAKKKLDQLLADLNSEKSTEEIAHAVYQARTKGRKIRVYRIDNLSDEWRKIKRSRKPSDKYIKQCVSWIDLFSEFMRRHYPHATTMDHVGEEHAEEFMDKQEQRGLSPKTYNDILKALRTVSSRAKNPIFAQIPLKESETINRIPYDPEEIQAIHNAAVEDPFIYPILVTALCSAMRLGDCCCLRWDAVDFDEGFLSVKTSKTGATTDILIFPLLNEVLQKQIGNGSSYVFPEQMKQYHTDPTLFTRRLRIILATAGFCDSKKSPSKTVIDSYNIKELKHKAKKYALSIPTQSKRERLPIVLDSYLNGASLNKIVNDMGLSKGTVFGYLKEVEDAVGIPFIRGQRRVNNPTESHRPVHGEIRSEESSLRIRRASLRDWHSFRTTWITLALTSGIPIEVVQLITGHATTEVVMKNYFKPQRAQIRQALETRMPKLLVTGMIEQSDQAIELLNQMDSTNWAEIRDELLNILKNRKSPKNLEAQHAMPA